MAEHTITSMPSDYFPTGQIEQPSVSFSAPSFVANEPSGQFIGVHDVLFSPID